MIDNAADLFEWEVALKTCRSLDWIGKGWMGEGPSGTIDGH
jgi:hypothetical protein